MWPLKKKQAQVNENDEAYRNFQNQVMGTNNSNNNINSSYDNSNINQQTQVTQQQPIIEKEKNIYIQKDQNGYAIMVYIILIIGFIIYFLIK